MEFTPEEAETIERYADLLRLQKNDQQVDARQFAQAERRANEALERARIRDQQQPADTGLCIRL